MQHAKQTGQYLFILFHQEEDGPVREMERAISDFQKASERQAELYRARANDPKESDLVDKYGVKEVLLPFLLVVAPNGVITGGFPGQVTRERLEACFVSDLTLQILEPLQEQKIALVCLRNAGTKYNDVSEKAVRDFAGDPIFNRYVGVVRADPAAESSRDFIKKCGLSDPIKEATVVMLFPPGQIVKIFSGGISKEDIFKALQSCSAGGGGCGGGCK
jgi:hypothetical protein